MADKILVTGGAGYLGNVISSKLLDAGYKVAVLDNLAYGDAGLKDLRGNSNFEFIRGDICSIKNVFSAAKGSKSVIALAAIVGDPAAALNEEETLLTNYESTKILVEACNHYNVERLIFASSCSVYGANDSLILNEGSWLNPLSLYAKTRIMSEKTLHTNCKTVIPTILRLSTLFGLSNRMRFDLVANIFSAKAKCEGRIEIFGGDQWRPMLHIKDAADAFIQINEAHTDKIKNEVFNVGSNELNFKIKEIGDAVKKIAPNTEVILDPKDTDCRDYRVSFDKLREAIGFKPKISLEAGVREIVDKFDFTQRNYRDDIYYNVKYLYK